MSTSTLQKAQKVISEAIQEDAPEWHAARAQVAQAAALIAIAEQAKEQNEHLAYIRGSLSVIASVLNHDEKIKRIADALSRIDTVLVNAVTLGGAIKIDSHDHIEEISNHLDDIGSVLLNARGPDGAIKVTQ